MARRRAETPALERICEVAVATAAAEPGAGTLITEKTPGLAGRVK
jgi:hypothetical protein